MKTKVIPIVVGAALLTATASADILSTAIDPTPFGNLAVGELRASITSGAPLRAFYITGTWNPTSGTTHWSNDMRIRPLLDGVFFHPTAGHQMQGGASNNSPYTYMHPGSTWNNTTRGGFLMGSLGGAANYASGGDYDFNFRTGFGATSEAQILDGTLWALTDAVAPITGNLSGAPTMANRPTNLTTISAAGTYHYQTFSFTPQVDGVFAIMADWRVPGLPGTGTAGTDWFDGHLNVYQGGFDPSDVLANLIGVSDDAHGANATSALRASGMFLDLIAGQEYTIVATHFGATFVPEAHQDFTLYIAGAVPAPGALALLGLAGLVGVRRRRA